MSDSECDSNDSDAFEALQRFANELDWKQLEKPNIPLPPLSVQLAHKSKVEAEELADQNYEKNRHVVDKPRLNHIDENVSKEFIIPFQQSKMEQTNICFVHPGRNTILPGLSGSLFSAETKSCIEKLLTEQHYSKSFTTFMHVQLTQNFEDISIRSAISKCSKSSSEEWHCIAKYLLFVMSICENEKTVDAIFSTLLEFADGYALSLEDLMHVFINWGVPEALLHPPYILDDKVLSDGCSQGCILDVKDYNIFKVLDFMNQLFYKDKIHFDFKSRMTLVRAVIMMWLDKRFAVSFNNYKFKTYVTYFIGTIGDVDGCPEKMEVVCSILNFSNEHIHNQGWIIKKLLEGDTPCMKVVGYYVASQFLLRVFCHPTAPCRRLNLIELHTLLASAVFESHNLYSVHVIVLVVDTYLTSYNITKDDEEIIKSIVHWTDNSLLSYLGHAKCEVLDKEVIACQIRHLKIKLKLFLEELSPEKMGTFMKAKPSSLCAQDAEAMEFEQSAPSVEYTDAD